MKLSALIAAMALLCGCATKGGRCYPIVGFGWVVVNTNQPSVTTFKTTLIGAGLTAQPGFQCVVGYGSSLVTVAETNNVTLELK